MSQYAQVLFDLINAQVEFSTNRLCKLVLWEQANERFWSEMELNPQVQAELDGLLRNVLGIFDNVGCVLPDGVLAYAIKAIPDEGYEREDFEEQEVEITEDEADYADMWTDYLADKRGGPPA